MNNIFRKAYLLMDMHDTERADNKHNLFLKLRVTSSWILTILLLILSTHLLEVPHTRVVQMIVALLVLLLSGIPFYTGAWKRLNLGHIDMDMLVVISISVTFLFSVFNTFFPGFWYARALEPHVYYVTIGVIISITLTGKMLERRILQGAPSLNTRITAGYIFALLVVSILTFLAWIFFGGRDVVSHGLYAAISVWIMACPCALTLVTPVALLAGVKRAAENRIIVKEAWSLEQMPEVDVVVLDKSGVLTEGCPAISGWLWVQSQKECHKRVLLAAGMKSGYSLLQPVVETLRKNERLSPVPLDSIENLPEKGTRVVYKGTVYWVGSHKLLKDYYVYLSDILGEMLAQYESDGNSIVYFGRENELLSFIAIKDRLKPTSAEAVKELRVQDIEICMLASDGQRTSSSVAASLGIMRYISDALPEDKETFVHELQLQGKTVAMVGNGTTDTLALDASDISITMGDDKDKPVDISMVSLETSDLLLLPRLFSLARQVTRLIHRNLFWALIFNLIGITLAAGVLYPVYEILLTPVLATVAMLLSGISVVLNSLMLKY